MKIPMYQVDAFTSELFGGNPAAVCLLGDWLTDERMQAIAMENNLSETAFLVREKNSYAIRWFTPRSEIDLAGHPTLAAAFVIFELVEPGAREVRFNTRKSGRLAVRRDGDLLRMDFPAQPPRPCEAPTALVDALGVSPLWALRARDYLVVLESEDAVRALRPKFSLIETLDTLGVIVTAPGRNVDFVSRFFAPGEGIPEDPVTGSAHTTLVPYWSSRLEKPNLHALQLSPRGGELFCVDRGERVEIAGRAVLYLEGFIWA